MKSSVLPTTSAVVRSAPRDADADTATATAAFAALLVPALLKPVLESLGPLGAAFGDAVARAAIGKSESAHE